MRMVARSIFRLLLITAVIWLGCQPDGKTPPEPRPVMLEYAPAPADNPLKGFLPFRGDFGETFPHSMEWAHFPLRELMTGPGAFTFDQVFEPALNEIAARGHQTVLRIHVDYPGEPSGVPQFLIDGGLKFNEYSDHGGGQSPNYGDENLISALEAFIAEFGRRYDGDSRIGFITVGLLGFWGEWHTYPHEDWFADVTVQNRILNAYTRAFKTTKFLVRRPTGDSPMLPIGYHDDSFAFSTLPTVEWHFMALMQNAGTTNAWQTQPIGGEIRPELQTNLWMNPIPPEPKAENFAACVRQTHASFLIAHRVFSEHLPAENLERARIAAESLGYEIYVAEVLIPAITAGQPVKVKLGLENRGTAPFYYDWDVQLRINSETKTDWKLSELLPGKITNWEHAVTIKLPPGEHPVAIRVVNPLKTGRLFHFANKDQNADGWLELGTVKVK